MKRFGLILTLCWCFYQVAWCAEPVIDAPENPPVKVVYIERAPAAVAPIAAAPAPAVMTAAPAPVAAIEAPKPANVWLELLWSPPIIILLATFAATFLNAHKSKQDETKKLEIDRWSGLVHHIYLAVEKSGALGSQPKLAKAMDLFDTHFFKTYKKLPDDQDRADLANDLAKLAYDDDPGLRPAPKAV